MKKILISLLFVLVSAVSANAQLLYRVSGADLKKPSYVFGTFHFANSPFVDQV
ncbi:MAG: TraB/GumN family protein, partial [Prevotella sp.]|nr:TraB/GumN family protein [Prevotella sp.]